MGAGQEILEQLEELLVLTRSIDERLQTLELQSTTDPRTRAARAVISRESRQAARHAQRTRWLAEHTPELVDEKGQADGFAVMAIAALERDQNAVTASSVRLVVDRITQHLEARS